MMIHNDPSSSLPLPTPTSTAYSLARTIHDAYRNCDNSLVDFARQYHTSSSTMPRSTSTGNRLAVTPTPASNSAQRLLGLTPSAVAAIRRSSSATPTSHQRLSAPANNAPHSASASSAPRTSRVTVQRTNSIPAAATTAERTAATTPATHNPSGRRVRPGCAPSAAGRTVVASRASSSTPSATTTARVHIATINFLPSPSVVRSTAPSSAASASGGAPRTPTTGTRRTGRPSYPNYLQSQRTVSSGASPRAATASPASTSNASAPTRNVGSIFSRTMIKLKTMVYKWHGSGEVTGPDDARDVASCAICLDEFQDEISVR